MASARIDTAEQHTEVDECERTGDTRERTGRANGIPEICKDCKLIEQTVQEIR